MNNSGNSLVESGSDSDATTTTSSTEHLTQEEKRLYVLRQTPRQEPQGQESRSCRSSSRNRNTTSNSVVDVDSKASSSCRTLIIHGSLSDDSWARIGVTGSIPDLGAGSSGHHYMTSTPNSKSPPFGAAMSGQDHDLCGSDPPVNFTRSLPRSAKDFSTLMYRNAPKSSNLASIASLYHDDADDVVDQEDDVDQRRKQIKILQGLAREMNWSLPVATATFDTYSPSRFNSGDAGDAMCSVLSMSDTLLNEQLSSTGSSSTNKECSTAAGSCCYARDFTYLSKPPPAYPRKAPAASLSSSAASAASAASGRRIKIRRALSRSHPDLSNLGRKSGSSDNSATWRALRHNKSSDLPAEEKPTSAGSNNPSGNVASAGTEPLKTADQPEKPEAGETGTWSTPELVDAILEENFALRQQVQNHKDNIAKLQKFEEELNAVNAAHQGLVRSSERKETLERSARLRLESELRRVQQVNAALRHQIDMLSASQLVLRNATSQASINCVATGPGESTATLQSQIARRDTLIAQLVSQNKELMTNKERQDIELCAQKATLQQQRSHIEILESALNRAQLHINQVEDQYRRQCGENAFHPAAEASRYLSTSNVQNTDSAAQSSQREMANMEIRTRELEARLSEKEMLIHLLQRASMDRDIIYATNGNNQRLPESVSLLNRHPPVTSSQHLLDNHSTPLGFAGVGGAVNQVGRSSSTSGVCSSPCSSLPSSSRGSAASVASSSPTRSKIAAGDAAAGVSPAARVANETAQSLDNQLRALDRFYQNKQSLIQALQSDKERFPDNYWPS